MNNQPPPPPTRQGVRPWPPALPGEPPIPPPEKWTVIVDGTQGRKASP